MALARMLARDAVKTATARGGRWMTTAAAMMDHAAEGRSSKWAGKGKEMLPVYVLAGMVTAVLGLGLHTAKQELLYAPDVHVKKTRRETLPEVVEPDHVADEADKFLNKSVLRKVAHVRDLDVPAKENVLTKNHRVETLKEVGVDPKQQ